MKTLCVLLLVWVLPAAASAQAAQDPVILVQNNEKEFRVQRRGFPPEANAKAYEALERMDLARKYRARRILNPTIVGLSLVAAAYGYIAIFAGFVYLQGPQGVEEASIPILATGLALAAVGTVGVIWGVLRGNHPLTPGERARVLDEYNASR